MWNQRYGSEEYVYGTDPNTFLMEHAGMLTGPVLSLAEGEGRNAVYLATLGLDVLGVDSSEVGLAKARRLARDSAVEIRTEVADLETYLPEANAFGSIVSIFAHFPGRVRQRLYPLVEHALQPGGTIVLEGYAKTQLEKGTGGPKDLDMLLSCEDVQDAFPNCETVLLQEIEREVIEGCLHTGMASVVQLVCRKKT